MCPPISTPGRTPRRGCPSADSRNRTSSAFLPRPPSARPCPGLPRGLAVIYIPRPLPLPRPRLGDSLFAPLVPSWVGPEALDFNMLGMWLSSVPLGSLGQGWRLSRPKSSAQHKPWLRVGAPGMWGRKACQASCQLPCRPPAVPQLDPGP